MLSRLRLPFSAALPLIGCALVAVVACDSGGDDDDDNHGGNGGSGPSAGGSGATGGSSAGTSAQGGSAGSSTPTTGGASTGGASTGGASGSTANGGSSGSGSGGGSGGTAAGGAAAGGAAAGGAAAGGAAAGASGAGGTGGTGVDPCTTALYCDDFEKYDTAPNGQWVPQSKSGTITMDTTEHVSGSKSVKLSTQAGGSATAMIRLQSAPIFPVPNNVVYGRMLFKLAAAPTASVHWTIITGLGTVPNQTYRAMYRYGGQMPISQGSTFVGSQMMANYETPDWYSDKATQGSDCWHHANGRVVPVNKWTCVEWKFDGPNNGMQLWLDGAPADDLTVMGHGDGCVNAANDLPWTAPTFAAFDLGWESYQQDDARTAWIDDVVVSTTPIGCPSAGVSPL